MTAFTLVPIASDTDPAFQVTNALLVNGTNPSSRVNMVLARHDASTDPS